MDTAPIIKRFDSGDGERRTFEKGSFEVLYVGGIAVGRAVYEPGWVWSKHARGLEDPPTCPCAHVVLVVKGRCAVKMDGTGETTVMEPGDLVSVPPGHESWVVGEERYVSLHFLGADEYGMV